ncbi:hypothetical protein BN8_05077 [Fibrisoma limi BUZ 3]|uniref:Nephrocystin 3-like N-terminal domain-containing protein n=1 Tax=Fibrisoma limi BUZ 3 TaxID=1185876 RepID=I2GPG2_9BACT|nr:ATP-binding protein [Fibrisoma limi]CCH55790.1 hypothetical protein BN8_05077 [Fibrisoma limi BUZ 3]
MITLVTTILTKAADAFLQALAGNITEDLFKKLKGDPAKNAYKKALGTAIQRYSTGEKLFFSKALIQEDGILSDQEVALELSQLIRFERKPNVEVIARKWKERLNTYILLPNFIEEVNSLLYYLEVELHATDVFRPVFDTKSLYTISANTSGLAQSLINIESVLSGLASLMDTRFGELTTLFAKSTFSIRDQIRDFTRLIEEKSRGFTGRRFIFDAINKFLQNNSCGYFFIRGDPGIGKSALLAQLVKEEGYIHHFNVRAEGINKASDFIKNICAQLIAVYDLQYSVLPPEATNDSGFLGKLLSEVSEKLIKSKCVIVVDALDEVDSQNLSYGANTLYLPLILPKNIFIIATTRKIALSIRTESEHDVLDIEQDGEGNIADIRQYLSLQISKPGIQLYIKNQKINSNIFIEYLTQKSQGNFIYLRYVLPEIESGVYEKQDIATIPTGLQNYYEDHWRRLREKDENIWFSYKLPVLVALTVVKEPVSIDQIRAFSKVDNKSRIRSVINEWQQFLYESYDINSTQRKYRLYHASFFDFVAAKQEILDEKIDLPAAHKQISDALWDTLYRD